MATNFTTTHKTSKKDQYSDNVAFNGVSNNLYGNLLYKMPGGSSPNAANQTTLSPASPTLPVQEAGYTALSQANSALRTADPNSLKVQGQYYDNTPAGSIAVPYAAKPVDSAKIEGAKQILNKATNKYIADNNLSPNQLGNGQRLISPEMAAQYAAIDYAASSGGGGGGGNSGVATPDYSAYYAALSNMMSGAPGMSEYGDISKYGGYGSFSPSQAALAAAAALAQQTANKPGAYQSRYQQQLDAITDEILGRGKFRYDFNADPQYQAYRDRYVQQAQEGMRDSMGQAAALTGGYGSSYGQQVGQQTYQGYMDALNDMIPTLRNQAYQEWLNEGEQAYNNANLLRGLEDTNYGRYRDTVSDWQNERNFLADRENLLWNRDRGAYESDRGFDFNVNQFNTGIDQDNRNFQFNRDQADFDQWFKQQQLQMEYAKMAAQFAKEGIALPAFSAYPGASGGSSIAGAVAGTVGASGGSSGGSSGSSSGSSSRSSSSSSSKSSTKNIVNAVNQAYQNGASWAEIYSGLAQDLASGAISQDQYTAAYKAAVAGAKKR